MRGQERTVLCRCRRLRLLCGSALTAMASVSTFSPAEAANAQGAADRERFGLAQAGDPSLKPQPSPASKVRPSTAPTQHGSKAGSRGTEPGKTEAGKGSGPQNDSAPNGLVGAAAAGASTSSAAYDIAARLSQNGAGTCGGVIDAEAAPSMVGVTESDTVSQWSTVEPRDKHAANVFIAQRYNANPAVPYGVTGLIASPTPSGSCDVTVVQVVSSPLPCTRVRETIARGGKVLGELAGIPLMQSADGQTMLMPTATNTCVLVGFRSKFGN